MNKLVLAGGAVLLSLVAPLTAASAHDYEHGRDHWRNYRFHNSYSTHDEHGQWRHRFSHHRFRHSHHDSYDHHSNSGHNRWWRRY